jgi:phage terminase large subunit-like protein
LVFQGVDLAISKKDDADKFAHCTIGIHPKTKNIYILDYFNRIVHYTFQKKLIKDRNERFDPIRVGIESNGYQKSLLEDMQVDDELSKIRAIPVFTDTDKTVRAWKLSAYFERGQVFLQEGMYELQEHLLKMPDGRYKDLFDALDIAVNTAFNKKRKVRDSEPGVI